MRHLVKTKKLKRTEEERKRLFKDLATALVKEEQITTFLIRAKWMRPQFERLVTLVKRAGDDKQLAFKRVRPYFSEDVARKFIEKIVPRYKDRNGGYISILHYQAEHSTHEKAIVTLVD